jgi:hypothetical protein
MSTTLILLGCWGVAMTCAVVFLLFKVDELSQARGQSDVVLRRVLESQTAFAQMVEKSVARARAVKTAKGAKGK